MPRPLALLIACVLLLVPAVAPAQTAPEVSAQDRAAILSVIQSQLAAFQRDDGTEAFSYASPFIQQKFRDPATFMAMVKTGYQPVYRPREVEVLELKLRGDTIQQEMLFIGPDGTPVKAVYTMQKQSDGSWKINGVYLLRLTDETT